MATPTKFLSHIYTITAVFFSIVLLHLAIFIHGTARTIARRSITTEQFLKIVDKTAPAWQFSPGQGDEPVECRVCLSPYDEGDEVRELKCKHTFHKGCVDRWFQQCSATCPLCRWAVLPEEVVLKHRLHRLQEDDDEYNDGSDEELVLLLYTLHGDFLRRFL